MRHKNILRGLLCAAVLLGAALGCAQEVSARETVLIAGNADLCPMTAAATLMWGCCRSCTAA